MGNCERGTEPCTPGGTWLLTTLVLLRTGLSQGPTTSLW